MTVGEMIARLQQHAPSLPVALADWNEAYQLPSMCSAEQWHLATSRTLESEIPMLLLILGEE